MPAMEAATLKYYNLLRKLEEAFPNRLPSLHDYDPQKVLVSIGHQEVIRLIQRLSEEDDGGN